ncbi:MAG: malate dehydrogenase (oxaloacetate-decarboxylating)(NADP+) [Candidatus Tokpelaia sp. JSC161]|nr:MAG: malate dehydrogenase (oxaloacetate-decarboxylating)(NADP+) [Candidatus Tokpelaia sp. JSC161]
MFDKMSRKSLEAILDKEVLDFHAGGRPGKLEILPTKSMLTQRDLSLAYSPGVAIPVKEIARDPSLAYNYTAKGNLVAVVSNGTAILGLGNLGALASKPVMEGKAVLFKRFADVDSIDLEVDTTDVDSFIKVVRDLSPSFGGINLEDIKAPDCFLIESRLREVLDIPVFHDDQHGTAIIAAAGLLNALYLTGRDMRNSSLVCNGAGSAGLACIELLKVMGFRSENVILCDTKGVIYKGRKEGMNPWKSIHAVETDKRTLDEAIDGADIFFGVSVQGVVTQEMIRKMAPNPIIFAMANPDPEITPEEVAEVRSDAIIATGRSDYPNQLNNVLCFPYIFRGALDVRAKMINEPMRIAAARALALLAREDVPDDVVAAYQDQRPRFGPNYIIPFPFDSRLLSAIPVAVAKAAMESGVAALPVKNMDIYTRELVARRDPVSLTMRVVYERVQKNPKCIVFAEGEEGQVMRAAVSYVNQKLGKAVLVGREDRVFQTAMQEGVDLRREGIQVINASVCDRNNIYVDYLYKKMQRKGWLKRDCQRIIKNDRNHFAAAMVAIGDADAMVTGATRNYETSLSEIRDVIGVSIGEMLIGLSILVSRTRTIFVADTGVYEQPDAVALANIAELAAKTVCKMGHTPRVAFLAFSTFGHMKGATTNRIQEAVRILHERAVDFEFDGEMRADVALNAKFIEQYPFIGLSGVANVLIMPGYHSASISLHMLQELGGLPVIGPILIGLEKAVQIVSLGSRDSDIAIMAAFAAYTSQDF